MRKYLEIAKTAFKSQIVYRFDILCSMLFTLSRSLFVIILWSTIFGQQETVGSFTLNTMITYYVLAALLAQLDRSAQVGWELNGGIRNGIFSKYMTIPAGAQRYFLAQSAGKSAYYLVFDLTAVLLWLLVFRIRPTLTADPVMLATAAVIVVLGLTFMVQFNYFIGLLTFHFQDVGIFLIVKDNLIAFITGTMVPLALLPDAVVMGLRCLPFYYVTYLPSMLLIGQNRSEALSGLLLLSLWTLVFAILNKYVYESFRVKYDGVGL